HGARAAADAIEDAVDGGGDVADAALALVVELLLLGAEGVVDLLALLGEIAQKLVELAEAALELLELHHEARELLVGLLGGVANRQGARDALPEKRELGRELGLPLLVHQLLAAALDGGPHAVELGEDLADP